MNSEQIKHVLEAALMTAGQPLSIDRLQVLFTADGAREPPSREAIRAALGALDGEYADRGIELVEVASGYRIQVRAALAPWINRLWEERSPRYSRALLETLAIIAYRQPITRAEIEDIRGVAVSTNIVKTLLEREWVRVAGHRDVPGRPAVYTTTRQFLDYFNLKSLSDLPSLAELRDIDEIAPDLFAAVGLPGDGGHGPDAPAEEGDATVAGGCGEQTPAQGGSGARQVEPAAPAQPAADDAGRAGGDTAGAGPAAAEAPREALG